MFWNHQTTAEESARPEGDLNDLAGELTGNARWKENGLTGPGLYAPIKVHAAYSGSVNDLAKSIGVSIRASGRAKEGDAEGRKGPVIESIASAKSVDFVTTPGAGGEILQLFEAAGRRIIASHEENMEAKNLQEANTQLAAQAAEIAKLRETVVLGQAATFVNDALAAAQLPAITKQRLTRELVAAMPIRENVLDMVAYKLRCDEALKAAAAEVAAITGAGQIRGMGATAPADLTEADADKKLAEAFGAFGWSKEKTELAARGRN